MITGPDELILPSAIHRFFNKPILLASESPREYVSLFEGVVRIIDPRSDLEWLSTRNYFEDQWDIRRQRISKAAITNAARHEALRTLLASILPKTDDRLERAVRLAEEWFEMPDERPAILALLGKHGLDENAITAQATALRATEIERIDKQVRRLEISCKAHLRDLKMLQGTPSWRFGDDGAIEVRRSSSGGCPA